MIVIIVTIIIAQMAGLVKFFLWENNAVRDKQKAHAVVVSSTLGCFTGRGRLGLAVPLPNMLNLR